MKKKIFLAVLIIIAVSGALAACVGGEKQPYYGTYKASGDVVMTIDEDFFSSTSDGVTKKYSYTYENDRVTLEGGLVFAFAENYQVMYLPSFQINFDSGKITDRNGLINAHCTNISTDYEIESMYNFYPDGTYSIFNAPYSTEQGTYTLNDGVLILSSGLYVYIDRNLNMYNDVALKDVAKFQNKPDNNTNDNPDNGNNTGGDDNGTEQPVTTKYTLNYSAGTGGSIIGETAQEVTNGEDGTAVTAYASAGYVFAGWSDGVTTATRQDLEVGWNISVYAEFKAIPPMPTYTLTYSANAGGTISGTANQTVTVSQSGDEVTAVPNFGYEFIGWSDGVATAARQDTDVTANLTVTAEFEVVKTLISTEAELKAIQSNGNYKLANGITLTEEFTPLCTDEYPFNGIFDGGGFTISNLTINTDLVFAGLFAVIGENGVVKNLNVTNADVTAPTYCGVLVGLCKGSISNISVQGKISYVEKNSYEKSFGGMVGRSEKTITNCSADVIVTVEGANSNVYVGGLVGRAVANIADCHSVGDIDVLESLSNVYAGGLVGIGCPIYDSYATGDVNVSTTSLSHIGGLVGESVATISDSYATGDVSATTNGVSYAGGLVGVYYGDGIGITNGYAIGNVLVTGNTLNPTAVGGLAGSGSGIYCFATGNIEVQTSLYADVGGLLGYGFAYYSYATGEINVATTGIDSFTRINVGGLVGKGGSDFSSSAGSITVEAHGAVLIGGLVGAISQINNSFTTSNISAMMSGYASDYLSVGGLAGTGGTCYNSYATGKISTSGTTNTRIGGIVGYDGGGSGIANCHWLYYVNGNAEFAVGYSGNYGIPVNFGGIKHTDLEEIKADMLTVLNSGLTDPAWVVGADGLPILAWQNENE